MPVLTFIDDTGFHRARDDQRFAALVAGVGAIFGTDIDVSPSSPDGQLLGVFSEAISDLDELAENVYLARSPAGARGNGLARLVLLNGILRKAAQFSQAILTLAGTPGTVITSGALVARADDLTAVFQIVPGVTIGGGGTVTAAAICLVTGPVHAPAGSLTKIQTIIAGWTAAINPADAVVGSNVESDPVLRVRRAASVAGPSLGILDGLFAALVAIPNVLHVAVFENDTDVTDSNGLPRHSINVIVDGGAATDIAAAIFLKKSLGVTMVGATTQTVTDSQGVTQTMRFDTPIAANIYATITTDKKLSADLQTQVAAALVAYGTDNFAIGKKIRWSKLFKPLDDILEPLDLDITTLAIGTAPGPTLEVDILVPFNTIARWDVARVVFVP